MYQVPPTVAKVRKRACATQIFRTCLGDIAHWSASFRPRLVNTQLKKRARGGGALVEENTSKKKGRQSFSGASAALPPLKALESTATVRGLSLSSLPLPVPTTRSWDQLSVGHDWRWPFTCAEFYDDFFFKFSSFYFLYFLEIRRRQFLFQLDFRHCFFIRRNLVKCWTFNCVSVCVWELEIVKLYSTVFQPKSVLQVNQIWIRTTTKKRETRDAEYTKEWEVSPPPRGREGRWWKESRIGLDCSAHSAVAVCHTNRI